MTRRTAERPVRVLSLNQYVHRATLGLPRAERLDAAAELRAHLLERVAGLEGQGYPREEAEYLAVRVMGDPGATNRQLLGHFFTTPVGWLILGTALLIGGGVWATQTFRPAGIWPSTPRSMDDTAINRMFGINWPRPEGGAFSFYTRTADLRFPKGTQYVLAAWMSYGDIEIRPSFTFPLSLTIGYGMSVRQGVPKDALHNMPFDSKLWQSKFRLVATAAPDFSGRSCPEGKYQSGALIYSQDIPKLKLPPGVSISNRDSITSLADFLNGFCIKDLGNALELNCGPLKLNSWSKAYQVWGPNGGRQVSYALLLFPTDKASVPSVKPEDAYAFSPEDRSWKPSPR